MEILNHYVNNHTSRIVHYGINCELRIDIVIHTWARKLFAKSRDKNNIPEIKFNLKLKIFAFFKG